MNMNDVIPGHQYFLNSGVCVELLSINDEGLCSIKTPLWKGAVHVLFLHPLPVSTKDEELKQFISERFPIHSAMMVYQFCLQNGITLTIDDRRKSLYGLFENNVSYKEGLWHNIWISSALNREASVAVFIHEAAHFLAHDILSWNEKPHSKKWMLCYEYMLNIFCHCSGCCDTWKALKGAYEYSKKFLDAETEIIERLNSTPDYLQEAWDW